MKIKFLLLISLILIAVYGCRESAPTKPSAIASLTDSVIPHEQKPIVICLLNPNDCINCLKAFFIIDKELKKQRNTTLILLNTEREIEKQDVLKTTVTFDLHDSINRTVIWNAPLFRSVEKELGYDMQVSQLVVYDPIRKKILLAKPAKTIVNAKEILEVLAESNK